MSVEFAVVGGDIDTFVQDEINNDAFFIDDEQNTFILPQNNPDNTPVLITEAGRESADGIFWESDYDENKFMPAAIVENEYGYRVLIEDVWTDWNDESSQLREEWVIGDISHDGVLSNEYRWNVDIVEYEKEFNQDFNEDGDIGTTIKTLSEIRPGEQKGAKLYVNNADHQKSVFIVREDEETPLLIVDEFGYPAFLYDEWGVPDEPGYGYNKAYAVADLGEGNGFRLAIKKYYGDYPEWELVNVTESGKLDWSDSQWTQDISSAETLFGEDLDGNGKEGFDIDSLTIKTSDTVGDRLAVDQNSDLFIVKENDEVLKLSDQWGGGSIRLDETGDNNSDNSWSRESFQVEYSSEDEKYYLAAKESWTNTWGGQTNTDQQWIIYEVSDSGSLSWDTASWNVNITNYEGIFGVDLDGDEYVGFNEANLEPITTDTEGVTLTRDSKSGSLYLLDGDDRKQILDQGGWEPHLEFSEYWADGSHTSTAYAVEKSASGGYVLAIKRENTWFEPEYSESEYTDDGINDSIPGSMGRDTAAYWVAEFNGYEADDSADWKQAFEDLSEQIFPYDAEASQGEGLQGLSMMISIPLIL